MATPIHYTDFPYVLARGGEAKVAAILVPGKGYYNDDPDCGHSVIPFLAYDLMLSGEVADSEVHKLVHGLFNGVDGVPEDEAAMARLRELGYGESAIGEMVGDPDQVLYDHLADIGCVVVWAPWDTGYEYDAEVVGAQSALDDATRARIVRDLTGTGAFKKGDRIRFTAPHAEEIAVEVITEAA